MKKIILLLIVATLLLVACAKKEATVEEVKPAEEVVVEKTASMVFAVQGEGDIAKKLIEGAVLTVKGVTEVNWDMDTKQIKVVGNSELVWEDVHAAIADAGFDTTEITASDEAYEALPAEAKYRKEIKKATLKDNQKESNKTGNRTTATRKKAE